MEHWEIVGWVLASSYRRQILNSLHGKALQPRQIADMLDIHLSHASQLLAAMVEKGIVVCLNEKASKGRLYGLTSLGLEIEKRIAAIE